MNIGINWLDFVIIIILLFYVVEGYSIGFIASLADLTGFILSFVIGLKFYFLIGSFLTQTFSMPSGISNAIGFLIVAFFVEVIAGFLLRKSFGRNGFLSDFVSAFAGFKIINKILGAMLGIFSGLILVSFILALILAFPLPVILKNSVSSAKIGVILTSRVQGIEKTLNSVFGGAINETINFLTVEPKSNENVALHFKTNNININSNAEKVMFEILNKERKSYRIQALILDEGKLQDVARDHCKDMFRRGYFSHYTPEGFSPFDRMVQGDIAFVYAGENLALSPNVDIAMQGLMNSPGHKANILSANFGRVGVGVIDGGIYGEMFCQEFTN